MTFVLFQTGCATKPQVSQAKKAIVAKVQVMDFKNTESAREGLYAQLKEWRGVSYKPGGKNKKGVDGSGFVYVTFNDRFGLELPRTTKLQMKVGSEIPISNLRVGDLVFFKTGLFKYHVGIYLEGRRFIHASEQVGVTMSSLDDPDWAKNYLRAVRIDD